MKNIHVLPTDKPSTPSRLFYKDQELVFSKKYSVFNGVNIYITSDEEIKEGDCILLPNNEIIILPTGLVQIPLNNFIRGYSLSDCKKIISTTDVDLIKDGIQAIPDEFLEWFVKNPSCEYVDLIGLRKEEGYEFLGYEIIVPKEEESDYNGKQEIKWISENQSCKQIDSCYNSLSKKCICPKEEPKQETLEEASYNYANDKINRGSCIIGFREGAKWQQERMYSEEEVIELLKTFDKNFNSGIVERNKGIKEWFEKFKKK
ncbi:MAG: hypothetical protein ACOVOV_00385 [Dolichospermum sp.]